MLKGGSGTSSTRAIVAMASNRTLGHHLFQQLVPSLGDREFVLELIDPSPSSHQLGGV